MPRSAQWDQWVAEARAADIIDVARKRPDLKLKSNTKGTELTGPCPKCGGDDRFSVTSTAKKKVFYCRGCKKSGDVIDMVMFLDGCTFERAIETITGKEAPKPGEPKKKESGGGWTTLATYVYRDKDGKPILRVRKCLDQDGKKQYPQSRWDGKRWLDGKATPKIPYNLPQLVASSSAVLVYFVEGEMNADDLASIGFTATTASEGAGAKWDAALTPYFKDRHVVILSDADAPGRKHAQKIAKAINAVAASLRVCDLFPERSDGSDVSDWLVEDRAGARLAALAKAAPLWGPSAAPDKPDDGEAGKDDAEILASPSAPMAVARQFVECRCLYNGALTLRYWHGCWWIWRTTHWVEVAERVIRARLYTFTEYAFYPDDGAEAKPWLPNRKKIGDLLEALSGIVILSDEFEQPCWIDGRETGPIVALTNGLLDIASRELLPHSPLYFGQVSVPFPYDPDAAEPQKFLDFLYAVWPDDPDAIDLVGEMYGYTISGRTDLHKIFMLVGPTRGGKGTLARLLQMLIGKQNACGPTLSSLGTEFGLGPLLGKSLAVISDVRFAGKNSEVAVERLLSISGEDTITVNRKYREQWTGKLSTRFLILSNLLPKLTDASSAIIGRIVLATSKFSWLGREDYQLENKIRSSDMPGILNFALEGLRRLTIDNENQFTRLQSSEDATATLRDLASPVAAFVRERCKLGSTEEVDVDELYKAFKQWADTNDYTKMDKGHFGRDLRAACPSIKKTRPRDGAKRHFVYAGVTLQPVGEDGQETETQKEFAL